MPAELLSAIIEVDELAAKMKAVKNIVMRYYIVIELQHVNETPEQDLVRKVPHRSKLSRATHRGVARLYRSNAASDRIACLKQCQAVSFDAFFAAQAIQCV